jgi:hypothetical protein
MKVSTRMGYPVVRLKMIFFSSYRIIAIQSDDAKSAVGHRQSHFEASIDQLYSISLGHANISLVSTKQILVSLARISFNSLLHIRNINTVLQSHRLEP